MVLKKRQIILAKKIVSNGEFDGDQDVAYFILTQALTSCRSPSSALPHFLAGEMMMDQEHCLESLPLSQNSFRELWESV